VVTCSLATSGSFPRYLTDASSIPDSCSRYRAEHSVRNSNVANGDYATLYCTIAAPTKQTTSRQRSTCELNGVEVLKVPHDPVTFLAVIDTRHHRSRRSQALTILEQKLDPSTLAIVKAALADSDRLEVIRDAFLEGSDAQAVQMIRDLDPVGIRKALGINSREQIIGSATAQILARPLSPFRATHLVVSPRCAAHFNIDDIRIGNRSQFLDMTSIAADLFTMGDILQGKVDDHEFYAIKIDKISEECLPLRIDMPVCPVGSEIAVLVTNIDHVDHEFYGALLGQVATY
jgi:hypothetical protein